MLSNVNQFLLYSPVDFRPFGLNTSFSWVLYWLWSWDYMWLRTTKKLVIFNWTAEYIAWNSMGKKISLTFHFLTLNIMPLAMVKHKKEKRKEKKPSNLPKEKKNHQNSEVHFIMLTSNTYRTWNSLLKDFKHVRFTNSVSIMMACFQVKIISTQSIWRCCAMTLLNPKLFVFWLIFKTSRVYSESVCFYLPFLDQLFHFWDLHAVWRFSPSLAPTPSPETAEF